MPSQQWKLRTYYVAKIIPDTMGKKKQISFENTVNSLFHTVSRHLGHSWLNTPQKETTKSQHASKQIPKISYIKHRHTKTANPETKFQHKIKIGNVLYPEFGNETPKYLKWKSEKKSKGVWKFEAIPRSTNSSCLGFVIWAPETHGNSKHFFKKVSFNKIT